MTPVTWNRNVQHILSSLPAQKPAARTPGPAADSLQLSPEASGEIGLVGRVALNSQAGTLSSDQTSQLYSQISAVHQQIVAGADPQAVHTAESQISQGIYSDAHDGAVPPSNPQASPASQREVLEAGRIVLNAQVGKLSPTVAQQLGAQLGTIHSQIADGADPRTINQLQNHLSRQIHDAAQGSST